MTGNVSAIIEETIRLQRQTNHWQMVSLIMIFICNGLILLSVLSIRKATRNNREWSEANRKWSEELSAASVDRSPEGQDGETRLDAKHESAGRKDDAHD